MNTIETPTKRKKVLNNKITIPPSPFMKCLGFGTGVSVYELNRSPICSQVRSPWAIKKVRKVISNETLSNRLKDEAEILKKLNHPNVIGFRALTTDSHGKMCLAMEACTISLGDMIEERNESELLAFPSFNIATVTNDIAKALDYLHNQAYILHCDIKSFNILVLENFKICKLCDFGIAMALRTDGTVNPELLKGAPLGTLPWMAPEAVLEDIVTSKSDIYSYGLVIWEMLALALPPPNEDDEEYQEVPQLDNSSNSNTDGLKRIDWRPELPAQDFSEDYDNILELFYCCTEKEAQYRPSAELLVKVNCEILKKLSNK